jgi:hypothetical protein
MWIFRAVILTIVVGGGTFLFRRAAESIECSSSEHKRRFHGPLLAGGKREDCPCR